MAGTTSGRETQPPGRSRWRPPGCGPRPSAWPGSSTASIWTLRASIPTATACRDELQPAMRRDGSRPRIVQAMPGWSGLSRSVVVRRPKSRTVPWIGAIVRTTARTRPGDLLGNAIASGAPAAEILLALRDPARPGARGRALMSWTRPPPGRPPSSPGRGCVERSGERSLQLTRESTPYGIPPMEGWTPGEVWTAPTAWSAWALARAGRDPCRGSPAGGSSGAQRRRTGRSPSEWMRARAPRPRPRRSPGRTPSRSWRCGPAIPASRRRQEMPPTTGPPRPPPPESRPR